jgi:hypothetical protein
MLPFSSPKDDAGRLAPPIVDSRAQRGGLMARVITPVGSAVVAAIGAASRALAGTPTRPPSAGRASAPPSTPPSTPPSAPEPPEPGFIAGGPNAARVLGRRCVVHHETRAVWTVTEVATHGLPGARGDRCLLFDGPGAVRRVWHYPPKWDRLSDAALFALSWGQ